MNQSRWLIAGICVAANIAVIWTIVWFAERINPESYPGELAYKPVDPMPPRVDLASIQRGWPGSLDEPGDRNKLAAYRRDIERHPPAAVAAPAAASAPAAPIDLGALLASADANAGKGKAQACVSCHDFASGGRDRIGPNLWGVIGRDVASRSGFTYSPAMTAQQGAWTYDRLFTYLASPARAIPGTKMSYAGMRRPEDRAAVVKYLASLGNSAPPLPRPSGGSAKPVVR